MSRIRRPSFNSTINNDGAGSVKFGNVRGGGGGDLSKLKARSNGGANDTNTGGASYPRSSPAAPGTRTRSGACRRWSRARGSLSASTRPSVAPFDGNNIFTRGWPAEDDVATSSDSDEEGLGPRIRGEVWGHRAK
ncbi:hypothetical protein DL770_003525 [Monosporascus sp. CRB-9-2]|nr:hypothetical protein DL770_003525 [Monosporascus sp. CRB-9-2]